MRLLTLAVLICFNGFAQVLAVEKPVKGVMDKDCAVWSDFLLIKKVARTSVDQYDTVDVIGMGNWTFQVKGSRYSGFVAYSTLMNTGPEIGELQATMSVNQKELQRLENDSLEALAAVEQKRVAAEVKKRQQDLYNKHVARYGKTTADKIKNHQYWIGMTREMARASLGEPTDINRTVTATVTKEQWVYRDYDVNLYFTNGICDAFQD